MFTSAGKAVAVAAGIILLLGSQFYGDWFTQASIEDRVRELETRIDAMQRADRARIAELSSELALVQSRLGDAARDVERVASTAQEDRARLVASLKRTLEEQNAVADSLREESGSRLGDALHEFDIRKKGDMTRIAGIGLQLNKTDVRARTYDITVEVDRNRIQKKGQSLSEPIHLIAGRDNSSRYEVVVNYLEKDRIRGYVSAPRTETQVGATPSLIQD